MRYPLLGGGKRLRPMLVLAAAEAIAERNGRDASDARTLALPAACALEFIHTYSLVHDDLPAMDDDTMRRGRATTHVVFGEGMAVLAGDALLTEAFGLLAREPATAPSMPAADLVSRKLHTLAIIADAAGACGMVGGQAIDLKAAEAGASLLDPQALRDMHGRKTGALIRASVLSGAIMAGGSPAEARCGRPLRDANRPGIPDRGRHPRRGRGVRRTRQDRRKGRGCRQANLPLDLRPGGIARGLPPDASSAHSRRSTRRDLAGSCLPSAGGSSAARIEEGHPTGRVGSSNAALPRRVSAHAR